MELLVIVACALGQPVDDPKGLIDHIRFTYKQNKDTFRFGHFRFEYVVGQSESTADAEAGIFKRSIKEEGLYIFDEHNARYELTADPAEAAAVTSRDPEKRTVATIAETCRLLTDGKVTLVDILSLNRAKTDFLHNPMILADTKFYESCFKFPLSIGCPTAIHKDLFRYLSATEDGTASIGEIDLDAELNGLTVCKVSIAFKRGECTYWVDLNRGAVPLRILTHYRSGNVEMVFAYEDLVLVRGAGWIPQRMLHVIGNGATVRRVRITEIDVAHRPPPSVFALDFPKPIGLVDRAKKLAYSKRKTWSLLKLPGRASSEAKSAVPRSRITPSELPGEIEAGPHWSIIVSAVVLILAAGGLVTVLMRSRKRFWRQ